MALVHAVHGTEELAVLHGLHRDVAHRSAGAQHALGGTAVAAADVHALWGCADTSTHLAVVIHLIVESGSDPQVHISRLIDPGDIFGGRLLLLRVILIIYRVPEAENLVIESFLDFAIGVVVIILEHLFDAAAESEENAESQLGVTAGLMLSSNSLDVEVLGNFAQASIQVLNLSLYLFAVVKVAEVVLQLAEEVNLLVWEKFAAQYLQEVAEVSATVEGYPVIPLIHHEAARDEVLGHQLVRDSIRLVLVKGQPRLVLQHDHRLFDALLGTISQKEEVVNTVKHQKLLTSRRIPG